MTDAADAARRAAPYLERWRLTADGDPRRTATSTLMPVRARRGPAMLKLAHAEEERRGAALMVWWAGEGAARVLEAEGDAMLMERASGPRSLARMARAGHDDEATRTLCAAAAELHRDRGRAPPATLVPLEVWFAALEPAAAKHGGVLRDAAEAARSLLARPREVGVLHGDLHHDNVLDFGARGWLAIDPKGLWGERGFDFANVLRNPYHPLALGHGRFARQAALLAREARLDRARVLRWTLAFSGLSAAWLLAEGEAPDRDLQLAELARGELALG